MFEANNFLEDSSDTDMKDNLSEISNDDTDYSQAREI